MEEGADIIKRKSNKTVKNFILELCFEEKMEFFKAKRT